MHWLPAASSDFLCDLSLYDGMAWIVAHDGERCECQECSSSHRQSWQVQLSIEGKADEFHSMIERIELT